MELIGLWSLCSDIQDKSVLKGFMGIVGLRGLSWDIWDKKGLSKIWEIIDRIY